MIYPIISNQYYRIVQEGETLKFIKAQSKLDDAEIKERLELAKAYNETLDPSRLSDPYTDKEKKGIAAYAKMLELKEMIGYIDIPKIDQKIPVYAGTFEEVLQKGAGHLQGTSLPIGGKSTHSVITAHRGLPKAKFFRDLDKLENGDIFFFHNIAGTLAYEVDQKLTVEPSNFDPVLVKENEDYMTLLTCTPYMINSHRLLVRGHRTEYVGPIDEDKIIKGQKDSIYGRFLPYLLVLLGVLFAITIYELVDYVRFKKKVGIKEDEQKD